MKKLMCAIAVVSAGICFADVTSANVVGYQNLDTVSGGSKMLVPTFLQVSGNGEEYCLADLSMTGYVLPHELYPGTDIWLDGIQGGEIIIRQLTKGGVYEKAQYFWIDNGKIKGWFADSFGTPIAGGAESVKFPVNAGLWVFGSNYKLVGSGAVNFEEVQFETVTGGSVAVGNGNPTELKLSDLSMTGYVLPHELYPGTDIWLDGIQGGEIIIRQLTKGGVYEKAQYFWIDNGKIKGWFADSFGTPIAGGADNVILQPGQGLWVFGSGYTMIIPGVQKETK